MSEQYSALAGIYDALMYDVSYAGWAEYLMDILNARGIREGANLLEYACGTGNITPVSYTHLDVYKRQVLQAKSLCNGSNCLRRVFAADTK